MNNEDRMYYDKTAKASHKRLVREVKNIPEYKVFRKKERFLFFICAVIHVLLSFISYFLIFRQFQTDAGTVSDFFFLSAILFFFFGLVSVFVTPEITTGVINSMKYNERKKRAEYKIVCATGDTIQAYAICSSKDRHLDVGNPVYVLDGIYIIRKEPSV